MQYKCGQGRHRVNLRKPIEQYVRTPKCKICVREGRTGKLYLCKSNIKRNRRRTCRCSGVPFPHNKGTLIGCVKYDKPYTEEEYKDWINSLADSIK